MAGRSPARSQSNRLKASKKCQGNKSTSRHKRRPNPCQRDPRAAASSLIVRKCVTLTNAKVADFGAWQPARLGSKTRPRGKRTQPARRLFEPGQYGRAEDEDILVKTWSVPLLAAAMMGFASLPAVADDVIVARVNGNDIK